jgi:hypothetical protein
MIKEMVEKSNSSRWIKGCDFFVDFVEGLQQEDSEHHHSENL